MSDILEQIFPKEEGQENIILWRQKGEPEEMQILSEQQQEEERHIFALLKYLQSYSSYGWISFLSRTAVKFFLFRWWRLFRTIRSSAMKESFVRMKIAELRCAVSASFAARGW